METIYHIYAKNKCIMPNIKQSEFDVTWKTLNNLISLLDTKYTEKDLSFEKLSYKKSSLIDASY